MASICSMHHKHDAACRLCSVDMPPVQTPPREEQITCKGWNRTWSRPCEFVYFNVSTCPCCGTAASPS